MANSTSIVDVAKTATLDATVLDGLSPEDVDEFKVLTAKPQPGREMRSTPLVAKGDSWFDFMPGTDVIDCLRALYRWNIHNFSKAGDTLENMIVGSQTDGDGNLLAPGLTKPLAMIKSIKPKALLFSGGGNDVAGSEFVNYLNHARSKPNEPLREELARYMIGEVFSSHIQLMIDEVRNANASTSVVMHGYGHAHPTGKGVGFLIFKFAGPWLKPGLEQKGIEVKVTGTGVVHRLIDDYNQMLQKLADKNETFKYVDLRDAITESDWRDELHLKNSAYAKVAERVHKAIGGN